MSEKPKLSRLLSRRKIESWLSTFSYLDESLLVAIITSDGKLFARSGAWESERLDLLLNLYSPELCSKSDLAEGAYCKPLLISSETVGFLVLMGQNEETTQVIGAAIRQGLALMLKEANENRGLAFEALERYRELNLLYRVSETIGATLDPAVILSRTMEESRKIIKANFGLVLLRDAESKWSSKAVFGIQLSENELQALISFITADDDKILKPSIITELSDIKGEIAPVRMGTLLWAPLATTDEILGGILLGRSPGQPLFVANDQKLLTALAGQAAISLDKANLFHETKTYAQHLQQLNAIGRDLSSMLELEPILHRILRAAVELSSSEEGAFFLVDQPSKDLVFSVVEGGSPDLIGVRVPHGKGIVGRAAVSLEPQIVHDVRENKFWFDGIDKITESKTQSILAVPLVRQDEAVGVLEVMNRLDGKPFQKQDIERLTALASQAVVAMQTARLHQAEMAKQRMERELQLGHAMQSSLIPAKTPDLSGWDFAAWWLPAREVSGDFYDFIRLDDEVGLVMADVADKGVQSALFMTLTRSTVRASLHALRSPATGIEEANRLIAQDATQGMFVTLCYAQLRPNAGRVTYVNAGHNPPLWYHRETNIVTELEATGIFLGFDAGIPYEEKTIKCDPGDFIVLYTDGVTEAMNSERELFGETRFRSELLQCSSKSPAEMLAHIQQVLAEFVGDTPRSDDITLVIAKRK